jgi:prophage regulatory protein
MVNSATVIRIPEVSAVTGLPRATIYRHIKNGVFPQQIKLGPRCSGWLLSEVESWINLRASARAGAGK